MARIHIDLPDRFTFSTELTVRITDINYGRHLANDAVMSILHEARMQWLHAFGYTELNIEGVGLIMVDAAIQFTSQSDFADRLRVELAPIDWSHAGFELCYRIANRTTGKDAARARTGMYFFRYDTGKISGIPPGIQARLSAPPPAASPRAR